MLDIKKGQQGTIRIQDKQCITQKKNTKLESNQNISAVQAAEFQKNDNEHKQKKKMFSCSDCDKKILKINL